MIRRVLRETPRRQMVIDLLAMACLAAFLFAMTIVALAVVPA